LRYLLILIILVGILHAKEDVKIKISVSSSCKLTTLDRMEIKEIFLKKREYLDGELIIVLDNPDKLVYRQFVKIYIHKTIREMKAYWMRMLFTGKTIPPEKLLLTKFNKDNDNMCYISYFRKNTKLKHWKTLEIR